MQILMSVQNNQTNVMRLMLTVAILLVAMTVNVMLASLEMVVTVVNFIHDKSLQPCMYKL